MAQSSGKWYVKGGGFGNMRNLWNRTASRANATRKNPVLKGKLGKGSR